MLPPPPSARGRRVEPTELTLSLSLSQVVYFGRCVPWILIDYMGWFKQYKLQQVRPAPSPRSSPVLVDPPEAGARSHPFPLRQDKSMSMEKQWQCTKAVLKTHFSVELPQVRLLLSRRFLRPC